jgi:polysaccharide biosynthesis protein PslH
MGEDASLAACTILMRILFLSRWFPFPPNNGTKLRIASLLRGLSQGYDITLVSFSDQPAIDHENNEVKSFCSETFVVPWKPYNPKSLNAWLGFFNPAPRSIVDTFSIDMAETISSTLANGNFDLVIASTITMASYAAYFKGMPAIFEEIELGVPYEASRQPDSFRYRVRNSITWYKQRQYMANLLQRFHAVTVVSEQERQIFRETFPDYKNIHIIPNSLDFREI